MFSLYESFAAYYKRGVVVLIATFIFAAGPLGGLLRSAEAPAAANGEVTIAFIADTGYGTNFRSVLNLIKSEGADAIVHLGDFDYVYDADGFFAVVDSVVGSNYPYFIITGNHDVSSWPTNCSDGDGCYAQFARDRMARIGITPDDPNLNDQMYSINYQGIKLVFVGQTTGIGDSTYAPYIDRQLTADSSNWRICAWHKNQQAMQVGSKTDEMGWQVYETCRRHGAIIATSHEHSYHRTRTLIDMDSQTVDPVWPDANTLRVAPGATFVFVSGLGGKDIRNQDRCLPATFPYGCKGEWANIYTSDQSARFGALFITFNTGGDSTQAHGYFKNINGQVIDDFTITRQSGTSPTATPTRIPPTPTLAPTTPPSDGELLSNGSFEADSDGNGIPDGWSGRNINQDTWVCDSAHSGSCSFRFTGDSGARGELSYSYNMSGEAGEPFVFRVWSRSSNAGTGGTYAARTMFYYTDGTYGSFTYRLPTGTYDWRILEKSFTPSKPYRRIVVTLMYGEAGGTVWYDDVSLVKGGSPTSPTATPLPQPTATMPPPTGGELLVNTSYEADSDSDGVPDSWLGRNLNQDSQVCDQAHTGSCSFRFTGDSGARGELSQTYAQPGEAGEQFTFQVWTRSDNAGAGGTYMVRTMFYYTDGTYGSFSYRLPSGTNDWTLLERQFTSTRPYRKIVVTVMYGEAAGTVWYDDISLIRSP